jgi:uncharacterized protein YeaC (DUF1315 family)
MLKSLIIVLIIVILLAIGLNFDIFSSSKEKLIEETPKKIEIPLKNIEKKFSTDSKIIPITDENNQVNSENNLSIEVEKLLKEAHLLFLDSKDADALELYKKIIEKTKDSQNLKILEQFTEACMQMAFLYQIYPNSDKEMAIETYTKVINKFKGSKNSKLLEYYITATVQQAYLFEKDERAYIYDELIKKFENNKDKKLQKRVEELLINKSFELMGKEDEEAMEILDKLISKYEKREGKEKLPEAIELAILNNLELSIITSNDDEKYVDLANQYLSDSPDTKPLLEMLDIIKNAQYLEQKDAFETWEKENKEYYFDNWSFQEMRRWMNQMEDKETRERVKKYIDAFENHKYNRENSNNQLPQKNLSSTEEEEVYSEDLY